MNKKTAIGVFLLALAVAVVVFVLLPQKTEPVVVRPPLETPNQGETEGVYQSKIDFEELQKQNSDIYGWLTIPDTEIDYPVLQSAEDDTLYMDHNVNKEEDKNGSLFTEHEYNGNHFSDPVTIIYGHHMKSGAMFGNLQQIYTDEFEDHRDVVIYTPKKELHYQVFAAVPYSNRHILYYYDKFRMYEAIEEFLEEILSTRSIGSTIDQSVTVEKGDRLLVLSTCLQGDNTKRFLVIGKLLSE